MMAVLPFRRNLHTVSSCNEFDPAACGLVLNVLSHYPKECYTHQVSFTYLQQHRSCLEKLFPPHPFSVLKTEWIYSFQMSLLDFALHFRLTFPAEGLAFSVEWLQFQSKYKLLCVALSLPLFFFFFAGDSFLHYLYVSHYEISGIFWGLWENP